MKLLYVLFVVIVFTLGCSEGYCEKFVTYEERIPLFAIDDGEYIFNTYIIYEEVMSSCECLLTANERANSYNLFLEGVDVESSEYEFHSSYPSYYSCK